MEEFINIKKLENKDSFWQIISSIIHLLTTIAGIFLWILSIRFVIIHKITYTVAFIQNDNSILFYLIGAVIIIGINMLVHEQYEKACVRFYQALSNKYSFGEAIEFTDRDKQHELYALYIDDYFADLEKDDD